MAAVIAAAMLFAAACGDASGDLSAQRSVPRGLVPERLADTNLSTALNTDEATLGVFANVGPRSLSADSQVWELRRGDKLVGALQITTLLNKVDLTDASQRDDIIGQILPTTPADFNVAGVHVWAAEGARGKVVYVWFGEGMFEVLQVKGRDLDAEDVLRDVIDHQLDAETWRGLPPEFFKK